MHATALRCENADRPIHVAAHAPRFSWRLAGGEPAALRQSACRLRVATSPELIAAGIGDAWDSGPVPGAANTAEYAGTPLLAATRYWWSVEVFGESADAPTAPAGPVATSWFETTLLTEADWAEAQWLGVTPMWTGRPVYFRATFEAAAPTATARLYVAGLGCHYVWVNGQPVGDRLLEPPQTDYGTRVLFTTYDLDPYARPGRNTLVIACGPGWHGEPKFRARLLLRDRDGRDHGFASGVPTCQFFTRVGGWRAAGIYDGEDFDARLHPRHWLDSREPNDWRLPEPPGTPRTESHFNARRVAAPGGRLVAHAAEPTRITRRVPPVSIVRRGDGTLLLDFGENLSGFVELRPRRPRDTALTLRFAEFLTRDGGADQTNLYTAACQDRYVCAGEPDEVYHPLFTLHGFRYVEVQGFEGEWQADTFVACQVRSDVPARGAFSCSDDFLNRLQRAIVLCEADNQHGLLTDCPQRAERMGWLNDPTARLAQAVHNFDLNLLLEKWLGDIADTQDASGAIADTAPFQWGSRPADPVCVAPALIPWLLWRHYGNRRALEEHYPVAQRWHAYLEARAPGRLVDYSHYGDWCPPIEFGAPNNWGNSISRDTPGPLVSTALWLENTDLLAKTAAVLGRAGDAARYTALAAEIRAAFHARWFDPAAGGYGLNNQAANALAICLRIPPAACAARVAANLAADVERRGHLTTGNICTKYLLDALSLSGRSDLALRLARRREYPGWGFMLENGATTIWERWELNTSAGMNSHNHPMLGSVGGWFYEHLVGLRDDETAAPGTGFLLAPFFAPDLDHVAASLATTQGRLAVRWERRGRDLALTLGIPPHTAVRLAAPPATRRLGPGEHTLILPAP